MKIEILKNNIDSESRYYSFNDTCNIVPNDNVIYMAVKHYLSNQRQATSMTKNRGNITGSSRKIQKQKGTGNARKGDIKSPILRGGGTAFGPINNNYSFKINKKIKFIAKKSAFLHQVNNNNVFIIDDIALDKPNTKYIANIIDKYKLNKFKNLFVISEYNKNLLLSFRNLKDNNIVVAKDLNVYNIIKYNKLIFTLESIKIIENIFCFKNKKS
ncbi:MAG: 50S ribosomal protein L4 [Bacteroides sp.]|nr:MAG: 50S ribosomal protein L4 [Bacteroides sp.]